MSDPITLARDSSASNPGGLGLSEEKLRRLEPGMFGVRRLLGRMFGALLIVDVFDLVDRRSLREHLAQGDARAAVVVSTSPVLVAAYSDDLDCVAMLRFPDDFASDHDLEVGTRLVAVNQYYAQLTKHSDLTFGEGQSEEWSGFFPLIAEFLSDDTDRIAHLRVRIREEEWDRCRELGDAYLRDRPGVARPGRPRRAGQAAGFVAKIVVGTLIGIVGIVAFVVLAWLYL